MIAPFFVNTVEICFECSKMRFDSPWEGGIPLIWEHTLRSLFTHYGMPERSAWRIFEIADAPHLTIRWSQRRPT
jgi:hypothetical protein